MKLVTPVSLSDIELLQFQVDVLRALGGLENRNVVIVPTPSVADRAAIIATPLRAICRSLTIDPVAEELEGGWPEASNKHFGHVIQKLVNMGNDEPFFLMEPDCTPTQPGWMDDIVTEYHLCKKPYMGHLRNTAEVWAGKEGMHMIGGCAVYHPNFHKSNTLWTYPRTDQPYDVWIRDAVAPHAHNTNLVQHLRRTEKYRQEDDIILCQDCVPNKAPADFKPKTYSVSTEAVIVHGCRDGSLAQVVLKSMGVDPAALKAQEAGNGQMNHEVLFGRVREAVGTKRVTLKALSESLCVDKKELRTALERQDSPFIVQPPILYVSLKEQAQPA